MNMNTNPKVSCVMCTYGRYKTVQRSIMTWLEQDYENKELLIFNTAEVPLFISDRLQKAGVRVVNQSSKASGAPFTCLGDVRQAALDHMDGDIYVCWDDDDFFFPWFLSLGVSKYREHGKWAWKPSEAYMTMDNGVNYKIAGNALEATILVDADIIKKFGFSTNKSGAEHTDGGWMDQCRDHDQLVIEDIYPLESYCYTWGSPDAPHKTSGHIDEPNNFENHKSGSVDFGDRVPLDHVDCEFMRRVYKGVLDMERPSEKDHTALLNKFKEIGYLEGEPAPVEKPTMGYFGSPIPRESIEAMLGKDNVFWLNG